MEGVVAGWRVGLEVEGASVGDNVGSEVVYASAGDIVGWVVGPLVGLSEISAVGKLVGDWPSHGIISSPVIF